MYQAVSFLVCHGTFLEFAYLIWIWASSVHECTTKYHMINVDIQIVHLDKEPSPPLLMYKVIKFYRLLSSIVSIKKK